MNDDRLPIEKKLKKTIRIEDDDDTAIILGDSYVEGDFDYRGIHKATGTKYDEGGYDSDRFDKDGYDEDGYDSDRFDKDGYDAYGCGKDGYDKNGYDYYGFNVNGYDKDGYDSDGTHILNKKK